MHPVDLAVLVAILATAGLIYLVLVGGLAWESRRWWGGRSARAFWLAAVLSVIIAAIGIPVFISLAGALRHTPAGLGGAQRSDFAAYVQWTRAAFFAFYGLTLILSGATGAALGQRLAGRGWPSGLATATTVLVFLLVTLPVVEWYNACIIGEPFVLTPSC